jgi:hypothetical protein
MRLSVGLALVLVTAGTVAEAAPIDSLGEGRRVAALAFSAPEQFLALSDPKFVDSVGGEEKLRAFLGGLEETGPEGSLNGENIYRTQGAIMYARVAQHPAGLMRTQLTLDAITGKVTGYMIAKIAPKPAMSLQAKGQRCACASRLANRRQGLPGTRSGQDRR